MAMADINLNAYIVAGVIGISAGGLLLVRSYNTFRTVSYWNTIGMTVVGGAMIYGGIRAFQMKGSKDTDAAKKQIKEDVEKAISSAGEAVAEVSAAEFTEKQRERLAKKGSFPIRNKQDLKNAVQSWSRAKKSHKAKVQKFIKMRAKQLDAMDEIPQNW